GREKLLGNNPIAVAIPGEPPIVLDMALSVVARGYLVQAARAGKPIPEGWGVDADGNPTTDPNVVLEKGSLSPIATYKGSGLSLVIDAILGAIAGGGHSHQIIGIMEDNGPSAVPHFLAALKIEVLLPLAVFRAAAAAFADFLRQSPHAKDAERIWMPGEIEWTQRKARLDGGIPLSDERVKELTEIGERLELPFPEMTG
ncbi:MAG: Ldh family oxidoreductase, partial [bacterium]|nr:Ldh family oxidoreductase [bacterium]